MPVILNPDNYDLWLDPEMQNMAAASDLLKPYDARLMRCYPVSKRVNHVANDDEECCAAVELAQAQHRLSHGTMTDDLQHGRPLAIDATAKSDPLTEPAFISPSEGAPVEVVPIEASRRGVWGVGFRCQ